MQKKKLISILSLTVLVCMLVFAFTLTACHKKPKDTTYTVVFDLNDGSGATETRTLKSDETPYTPVREGHDFTGWTTDREGQNAFTALSDNLTLYAQWRIKTFKVVFYVGETQVSEQTVEYNQAAALPAYETYSHLIESGKAVAGWTGGDYDHIKADSIFRADVQDTNCTMEFYDKVGGMPIQVIGGLKGHIAPSTDLIPEKDGFTFTGWHYENGDVFKANSTLQNDVTRLFAYWQLNVPTAEEIIVNGETTVPYGDPLNLSLSHAANNEITYTFAWGYNGKTESGATLRQGGELGLAYLPASKYSLTSICTATSNINGTEQTVTGEAPVTLTVSKAKLTASVITLPVTYGNALNVGNIKNDLSFDGFKYNDKSNANIIIRSVTMTHTDYEAGSDVGVYSAFFDIDADNYVLASPDGGEFALPVSVSKKQINFSYTAEKTYDGNCLVKRVESTENVIPGHTLVVNFRTSSSFVGDYSSTSASGIVYSVTVLDEHKESVSKNYLVAVNLFASITPARISYELPEAVEYNGEERTAPILVSVPNAEISYTVDNVQVSMPMFKNAGTYLNIHAHVVAGDNYETADINYTFEIRKKQLDIFIDNIIVKEGESCNFSHHIKGFVEGEESLLAPSMINYDTTYSQGGGKGDYPICISNADSIANLLTNYNVIVHDGNIHVVDRDETNFAYAYVFYFDTPSVTYGEEFAETAVKVLSVHYNGNAIDLASGNVAVKVTCPDYTSSKDFGYYDLLVVAVIDENGVEHRVSDIEKNGSLYLTDVQLKVNKRPLTLTISEHADINYGDPIPNDLTFTYSGLLPRDEAALNANVKVSTSYTQGADASDRGYDLFFDEKSLNSPTLKNYAITVSNAGEHRLIVRKVLPEIYVEQKRIYIDYDGTAHDFAELIRATSTNTDTNKEFTLSIPSGRDGGIYKVDVSLPETTNFLAATLRNVEVCIRSAKLGNNLLLLEDALNLGGTITLVGDTFLSGSAELKGNSTLTLPCDSQGNVSFPSDFAENTKNEYIDPMTNVIRKLTVKSGTFTIRGTLIIGGVTSQKGGSYLGHTTGAHSVVVIEKNATVTVGINGILDCHGGFILGEGNLASVGGTIKENFVTLDNVGEYSAIDAFNLGHASPFKTFDLPNVQAAYMLDPQSTLVGYMDYFANGANHETEITLYSPNKGLFKNVSGLGILLSHNASLTLPKLSVLIPASTVAETGSLVVTLDTEDVDLSSVVFPISHIIDIQVDGTLNVTKRIKLLPGATLAVGKNGRVNIKQGGAIQIYETDWTDGFNGGAYDPYETSLYPDDRDNAMFIVKGNLTVESGGVLGGSITGVSDFDNTPTVTVQNGAVLSDTLKEGYALNIENANLKEWTETYSKTVTAQFRYDALKADMEQGKTYIYQNGEFIEQN